MSLFESVKVGQFLNFSCPQVGERDCKVEKISRTQISVSVRDPDGNYGNVTRFGKSSFEKYFSAK